MSLAFMVTSWSLQSPIAHTVRRAVRVLGTMKVEGGHNLW